MKPIEEIKSKVMMMTTPLAEMSGYIDLSSGRRVKFLAGRNEEGNEHVSVSLHGMKKLPTWEEMSEIKDIFWGDEENVVEIHPKKSEYVNIGEVLHLWRPADGDWNRLMGEAIDDRNT